MAPRSSPALGPPVSRRRKPARPPVGRRQRALAQICLEEISPGQVRGAQARTSQVGASQRGLGQVRVLQIGAEQRCTVEPRAGKPAIDHQGAGEVRIAEVTAAQVGAGQVLESEHRPGPAGPAAVEPRMPHADRIDFGLGQARQDEAAGKVRGHLELFTRRGEQSVATQA